MLLTYILNSGLYFNEELEFIAKDLIRETLSYDRVSPIPESTKDRLLVEEGLFYFHIEDKMNLYQNYKNLDLETPDLSVLLYKYYNKIGLSSKIEESKRGVIMGSVICTIDSTNLISLISTFCQDLIVRYEYSANEMLIIGNKAQDVIKEFIRYIRKITNHIKFDKRSSKNVIKEVEDWLNVSTLQKLESYADYLAKERQFNLKPLKFKNNESI